MNDALRRIYPPYAYSLGPIRRCYWGEEIGAEALHHPPAQGKLRTQVAVVGAGFTGLNAAMHLARAGVEVTLLEAEFPGFGASGRNGGFCCLGGTRASDRQLRRFGPDGPAAVRRAEAAAIAHVDALVTELGIDIDRHSRGEFILAHTPAKMEELRRRADEVQRDYAVAPRLIEKTDLRAEGMYGPTWHGALHIPLGFALHPRKYLAGLVTACATAGASIHGQSPVLAVEGTRLTTPDAVIEAEKVVFALNGYAAENLLPWLRGRILPAQSSVLATRAMTEEELAAQGWTSDVMAYEDRRMLHYFHLTPDRRMVFGQRGGLTSSTENEIRIHRKVRADFDRLFPAWKGVESPFQWSGMVCLTASLAPYCGPVPGHPGAFTAFGYHGNGVAMGSYLGARLAAIVQGQPQDLPAAFTTPPPRFPLGPLRRVLLAGDYALARMTEGA